MPNGTVVTAEEVVTTYEEYLHAGPLPHPHLLAEYDRIAPGAAAKIIADFQAEGEHRRTLQQWVVRAHIRQGYLGQVLGFLIGVIGVGGGIFLVHSGKSVSGLVSLISSLAVLVGVFAFGRRGGSAPPQQESDEEHEEN